MKLKIGPMDVELYITKVKNNIKHPLFKINKHYVENSRRICTITASTELSDLDAIYFEIDLCSSERIRARILSTQIQPYVIRIQDPFC